MASLEVIMPRFDNQPGAWPLPRWKVGALGGFSLYLDPSWPFWVVLGLVKEVDWRLLALGFVAVLIHAFAQAAASLALRLGTGSISLTVLGGYLESRDLEPLPFQMEPTRRRKYAAMIFAGPLSNLLLFAGVKLITLVGLAPEILQDFGEVNLYIALARLIPAYPLDGGRLILCWERSSARQWVHIPLSVILALAAVGVALYRDDSDLFKFAVLAGGWIVWFSVQSNAKLEKLILPSESARGKACPGCGEHLPPIAGPTDAFQTASPACWARYVELMADLESYGGGPFGELITDAYAVQHPGKEPQSVFRSVDIHLLVLYGVLERRVSPEKAQWIRDRATRNGLSYYRLDPPSFRTTLKVGNILEAPEPERPARIEQYVRSVWAAWANEHRRLIEKWYNQEVVPDL